LGIIPRLIMCRRQTGEPDEQARVARAQPDPSLNAGDPVLRVASVERGIRLSPSDPRLFIWLSGLAAAHYQARDYAQVVEIGRRSWTLNRNYFTGPTYVVAALAQLGREEEARAALGDLRGLDPKLTAARTTLKLYQNQAGIDHLLDGLRKAGFE